MGHHSNSVGKERAEPKTQLERRGIVGVREEETAFSPGNSINRYLRRVLERNQGLCFGKTGNLKTNFAYVPPCLRPAESSRWRGEEIEEGQGKSCWNPLLAAVCGNPE